MTLGRGGGHHEGLNFFLKSMYEAVCIIFHSSLMIRQHLKASCRGHFGQVLVIIKIFYIVFSIRETYYLFDEAHNIHTAGIDSMPFWGATFVAQTFSYYYYFQVL